MSKKQARRILAAEKQGLTVKEFLRLCSDMGTFFDEVQGTTLEVVYNVLRGLSLC